MNNFTLTKVKMKTNFDMSVYMYAIPDEQNIQAPEYRSIFFIYINGS